MRETIYKCDQCKKVIGNKKHISLQCGQYSGIANPPDPIIWEMDPSLNNDFLHFCSGQCIGKYFGNLLNPKKVK